MSIEVKEQAQVSQPPISKPQSPALLSIQNLHVWFELRRWGLDTPGMCRRWMA